MSIDLRTEPLLSLSDAAKSAPTVEGKRIHPSTLWRWCRKGLRGIHLEYARWGHRVCTSEAAIARFAQRLAEADTPPPSVTSKRPSKRTPRSRERDIAKAEAELASAGI